MKSCCLAGGKNPTPPATLTHTDAAGRAAMVDVSVKPTSVREARACATIHLGAPAYALVEGNKSKKGVVLTVAQLAGIQAAKHTSTLIPLCHNLLLFKVRRHL